MTLRFAVGLSLLAAISVSSAAAREQRHPAAVVGLWHVPPHYWAFYGDGYFFIDPEPETRPLGSWRVIGDSLVIRRPRERRESTYRILKLTRSQMLLAAADGTCFICRRAEF